MTATTEPSIPHRAPAVRRRTTVLATAVVAIIAIALVVLGSNTRAYGDAVPTATYEVVEDVTGFVFDEAPVHEDGAPAYGNSFVTRGVVYEQGALARGAGFDADGNPTHPELVVGHWLCEGFFIGDGARTETGPWVVTSQVFDFGDEDGIDVVTSHGTELADIGVEIDRAITGGTGEYAGATGTHTQVLEGFADDEGVQLTMSFTATD